MDRPNDTLNRKMELIEQLRRSRSEAIAAKQNISESIQEFKNPMSFAKLPQQLLMQKFPALANIQPRDIVIGCFVGALALGMLFGRKKRREPYYLTDSPPRRSRPLLWTIAFAIGRPIIKEYFLRQMGQFANKKGLDSMLAKIKVGRS